MKMLMVVVLLLGGAARPEDAGPFQSRFLLPLRMGGLELWGGIHERAASRALPWPEVKAVYLASEPLRSKARDQDLVFVPNAHPSSEVQVEFWAFRGAPNQCSDEPMKGERAIRLGGHKAVLSRFKERGGPLSVSWESGAWCLQLTAKGPAIARLLKDAGIIAAASDAQMWSDKLLPAETVPSTDEFKTYEQKLSERAK